MKRFEILEEVGVLNQRGKSSLRLDRVRYDASAPAFDLRIWYQEGFALMPGRGLTLRENDLAALYEVLQKYYTGRTAVKEDPEKAEDESGSF